MSAPGMDRPRGALHAALAVGWVCLLGLFFAMTEIQIEGGAGWAANLPTWRIEHHWLLDIFWGGRPMTGYHAWVFPFVALFFHYPFFMLHQWSLRTEARALGSIMLFWIVEDYLWFVFNPAYGIGHFDRAHIAWHVHWLWFAPTDYWVGLSAAAALFFYSYKTPLPKAALPAARDPAWGVRVGASANFFRVTPTLYRSAQLGRADVAALVPLGIKTVVGLRAFHRDDKWLRESGIRIRRIKIYTWRVGDANVVAALQAIRAAERDGPVLLHCWHGADRTGLVAAMYRVLYQGWSKDEALDELENGGYGYHAMWKNIPTYLRQVDVEQIRRLVGPDGVDRVD